uniref:Protein ARV n=1 Tax=Tanacetum cinerariifolium TaxID=118510 RepID=A0A6L2JUP0_TANCI|nr:protein arv1 homolog isoform X2 [Tanacetum cinerariifolium]
MATATALVIVLNGVLFFVFDLIVNLIQSLLIDLILHKAKAYRHLFYNMFDCQAINLEGLMRKLTIWFLLSDACILFIPKMILTHYNLIIH